MIANNSLGSAEGHREAVRKDEIVSDCRNEVGTDEVGWFPLASAD